MTLGDQVGAGNGRMIVERTFLTFADAPGFADEPCMRRRGSSDSGVGERCRAHMHASDDECSRQSGENIGEDNIVPVGFCEDDQTDNEHGQAPTLVCYSHIRDNSKEFEVTRRERKLSDSGCSSGGAANHGVWDGSEEIAVCSLSDDDTLEVADEEKTCHLKHGAASGNQEPLKTTEGSLDTSLLWPGAGASSAEIRRRLQHMASANARLQAENAQLRLRAERVPTQLRASPSSTEGTASTASPSRPRAVSLEQALSAPQVPPQPCMSAWWVPTGVAVPSQNVQMATRLQTRAPPQVPADPEVPKARRGRRARARAAREVVGAPADARSLQLAAPAAAETRPLAPAAASAVQATVPAPTFGTPNAATAISAIPIAPQSPVAASVPCGSLPPRAILPAPVKSVPEPSSGEPRTTVMLRNMPNNYSRAMVLEMIDSVGFAGRYDFFYLPIDFRSRASLGYAFVNLVSHEAALAFWAVFDGYSRWVIPSRKVSGVSWSEAHQGLEAHVERYRNSPVMSDNVPDDYKPVIFVDGVGQSFPAPTRKLRPPRLH